MVSKDQVKKVLDAIDWTKAPSCDALYRANFVTEHEFREAYVARAKEVEQAPKAPAPK